MNFATDALHRVSAAVAFGQQALPLDTFGRHLLALDNGLGLFRLAHLLDALSSVTPSPRHIVSVGSGTGYHEAVVATLYPAATVVGLDLRSLSNPPSVANLSFQAGDFLDPSFLASIGQADFVYSIECLEHITADHVVADAMARLVSPRGWLYLQVPFATETDCLDSALIQHELDLFGHVRPGYTAEQLHSICQVRGLQPTLTAGAFWSPVQPSVWALLESVGPRQLMRFWSIFYAVAKRDIREGIPINRSEATAIKILASRPEPPNPSLQRTRVARR